MSSYRSYVPWKSNLQTSYKSGSSSAYSSRDDINGTRFGSSLSTPTSYRPSFSGGTYRVKRDTTPVTSPYVSRYSSTPTTATTSSKDEKDKSTTESLTRPIKDTTSNNVQQQKYLSGSLSKDSSSSLKTSPSSGRYSTSTSNLSKYGRRSRDPSPGQESLRSTSSLAATRIKSREPSPAARTLRGKSRDPSPAIESKSKLGTSYGSSSYRLTPSRNPSTSPGYTPRYGNSSSISYLSASDFRARSVSRAREIAERKSHDRESEKEAPIKVQKVLEASESKETTPEDEGEEEEENENDDEEEEEESESSSEEIFVPVSVCTRGTSPTPPSSSTVVRMRRNELAKTIEKTIKRSSKRPKTLEKGIQSDRMDDSTRYSRFGLSSRMSSYSPHESRYTPSLRYSSSVSPLVKSSRSRSRSDISDRKDDSKSQSPDTKACVSPKSKLSPPKNIRTSSRQASVENLSLGSKGSPELEGVVKTSITVAKLPNKDFRKSALNVGPTDRPRKSRTPSTSTDSDDKLESKKVQPPNGTTQFILRQEKSSSSSGSETSSASTKTSLKKKLLNGGESKIRQRCHPAKSSTSSTSPMSSSPSPSGHQNTTAKINVNMATEVNSESSSDNNRKLINKMSELTTTTPPPTIQQRETGALDASPKKSSKNKLKQPPPPVSETETEAAVDNDAVFDVVVVNKGNQIGTPDSFNSTQAIKAPLSSKEKHDDDDTSGKCNLLEKLGSISNFFAARQHDANSEPLYVDRRSSESASGDSISSDLKQKVSLTTTTTVPLKNRENSIDLNTTSTTTTTSPSTASITAPPSTEPVNTPEDGCEDTSIDWWQDNTSEQISTASALDIKDDMRYRLRHIDSGEVGWWLKNEDDDTLADDLKTLNQEDEEAPSEMTDPPVSNQMEETWWNQQNEGIYQDSKLENKEFDWPANENEAPVASIYPGPPKHVSPEAYESDETHKKSPESLQNGFIKLNICRVESGERPWWLDEDKSSASPKEVSPPKRYPSSNNLPLNKSSSNQNTDKLWWMQGPTKKIFNVRHVESGERPTWLTQNNDDEKPPRIQHNLKESEGESDEEEEEAEESENDEEVCNVTNDNDNNTLMERLPPLGDRASPDGLEDPTKHRKSPYESSIPMMKQTQIDCNGTANGFNAQKLFISRHTNIDELLGGSCRPMSPLIDRYGAAKNTFLEEITPDQVRIHDSTAQMPVIQRMERDEWDYGGPKVQPSWLDDAALQVYKDGDYGAYLDLESSLAEQTEEIEGLNTSRKNSLVVRTQLSVRVHAIIEKLLSSEGSELRRALFSLKQVFQEDKDLVHAFVALGGLNCLVRVGNGADQNYQNYILRALGQVMLYVDGMNGVMKHEPTMKWLYSLIASKYRLVVKTALKLLLVFVEYVETNCYLLVNAIHAVDSAQGTLPWSNIMKLLKDYDNADTELLIYATSLINKTLAGLNDQDSFYDESDLLEQQGMEGVIQRYMSRPGTDLDLLDQLQLYEAVLKFEDGEADGIRLPDNSLRKTMRYRPSTDTAERRKSRRHSTGTSPSVNKVIQSLKRFTTTTHGILDEDSSSSNNSNEYANNGYLKDTRLEPSITPGFRRRRERVERQKSFLREQQEAAANGIMSVFEKPTAFDSDNENERPLLLLKRDHTVKDLTTKLSNLPMSPTQEDKLQNRIVGDMTGLISKAKEGLAKSKSKGDISRSSSVDQEIKKADPKKSENELHWEELVKSMSRPLNLCDMDFTDLNSEDEKDVLAPRGLGGGIPPPPPPQGGMVIPPPMMIGQIVCPPPMNMPPPLTNLVPPMFNYNNHQGNYSNNSSLNNSINGDVSGSSTVKKNKKTVKLFWKEVREDMIPVAIGKTIWDELPKSNVDTQKLEHLFESRAKDLMTKEKQQEMNKNKEIIVLDHKRSNAINIAMTKLPPPRAIKAAILKMDATVVTREGIDKLLNMLPTDEERGKIQEAQMANPELPLGSAEQFLLTLASISELAARLKLWAFRLDFENSEKEIAEPLMDLKQGIELLRQNRTFKCILSTLLSVGIFLNGAPVKGFQIEYLAKVPEVKDTVHKHSLLHHLCHMVMETCTDTTDLYSEIGPITRASKADFADLAHNLIQLEIECKLSWDRLKLIAKHDCPPQLKQKLVDFLADCAERIIILQIVHRRIINRYRKFLLWLGVPQHSVAESKPNEFCRIVSEFALEYRTTRERVQQQIEKKANHRERNKTRGKMIIDVAKFRTKEDRADAELKELLGSPSPGNASLDGTLTWRRRRAENLRSPIIKQNDDNFTDGDDEILESLVKTATKTSGPRPTPRERKRTRHADRKSLRRTLKNGLTEEEKQHVAALIKTY
ncbi:uncharacterized protein LOC129947470 isoform X3 [Eupeodes corollae]|uniref:uncharacterized protein LOC129947470 isoform X3 n=1 Tax=Eupeodes corollae TaxID=290404 RepID=UPI0024920A44|nr:uncharacterized protein LOC129947470 isoform X3 [Eupeodes corollae]